MAKAQAEKAKEKAEKARDEAEQHGYDVGVAEIKDTHKAKVLGVYRLSCTQVWMKPLIRLGLRLPLHLGRQRMSTTLSHLPFFLQQL